MVREELLWWVEKYLIALQGSSVLFHRGIDHVGSAKDLLPRVYVGCGVG